jgi:tRNA (uracil-5-)-methyltransferase TRM9
MSKFYACSLEFVIASKLGRIKILNIGMKKNQIDEIMKELEFGYDQMSEKFSETRKFFWRDLEFIADYVKNNDKILDYGCGNGRLLEILSDKKLGYFGIDISRKLINLAKQKYKGKSIKFYKISSSRSLPFSDNYFNAVISIAVFHHFPPDYAEKMAKELFRILRPGGIIIMTVWNLNQERFRKLIKNGSKDIIVPFKDNDGKVFDRYHYLYTKKDLKKIFTGAGFKIKKLNLVNGRNVLLIGKK